MTVVTDARLASDLVVYATARLVRAITPRPRAAAGTRVVSLLDEHGPLRIAWLTELHYPRSRPCRAAPSPSSSSGAGSPSARPGRRPGLPSSRSPSAAAPSWCASRTDRRARRCARRRPLPPGPRHRGRPPARGPEEKGTSAELVPQAASGSLGRRSFACVIAFMGIGLVDPGSSEIAAKPTRPRARSAAVHQLHGHHGHLDARHRRRLSRIGLSARCWPAWCSSSSSPVWRAVRQRRRRHRLPRAGWGLATPALFVATALSTIVQLRPRGCGGAGDHSLPRRPWDWASRRSAHRRAARRAVLARAVLASRC